MSSDVAEKSISVADTAQFPTVYGRYRSQLWTQTKNCSLTGQSLFQCADSWYWGQDAMFHQYLYSWAQTVV